MEMGMDAFDGEIDSSISSSYPLNSLSKVSNSSNSIGASRSLGQSNLMLVTSASDFKSHCCVTTTQASRSLENPTRFHLEQKAKKSAPSTVFVEQCDSVMSISAAILATERSAVVLQHLDGGDHQSFGDDPLSPLSQTGSDLDTDSIFASELTLEHVDEIDWNLIEPTLNQLSHTMPAVIGGTTSLNEMVMTGDDFLSLHSDSCLYPSENYHFDADDTAGTNEFLSVGAAYPGPCISSLTTCKFGVKASTSAPAKFSVTTMRSATLATNESGSGVTDTSNVRANASLTSNSQLPKTVHEDDVMLWKRERFKKDSHNRIERKRRENINHQIAELSDMLPNMCFRDSEIKKNKGSILKASVEYIRELSNREIDRQKLELENNALRDKLIEYENLIRGLGLPLEGALKSSSSACSNDLDQQRLSFERNVIKCEPFFSPHQDLLLMDPADVVSADSINNIDCLSFHQHRLEDWASSVLISQATKLSPSGGHFVKDEDDDESMEFNS